MAFGTNKNDAGRNSQDRLNRDRNNPANDPNKDRVRGEDDPSKREGLSGNEDLVPIDESETPGDINRTADANLDE